MKRWKEVTICLLLMFVVIMTMAKHTPKKDEPVAQKKVSETRESKHNTQWTGFDALSFGEAFNRMYKKHGEGYVFDWRGKVYLTKHKERK